MRDPFDIVGSILGDRYVVQAVVAEGGFSVVYRAEHIVWHRPVAIKAFKGAEKLTAAERDELLEAFLREGAILAELSESSAAICQARDTSSFTTKRGEFVPYMVLEWLDGETLDSVLRRERATHARPRSLREAMRLLAPVAEALGIAHERGICHLD